MHETLGKNTVSSARALKEVLGPIKLEPIMDKGKDFYGIMELGMDSRFHPSGTSRGNDSIGSENDNVRFKPYYVAHTKIQTLALLDDRHKGSNWYHWRRSKDSNPGGSRGP